LAFYFHILGYVLSFPTYNLPLRPGGFLNPGAREGWVLKATPRPLYTRERDSVPIVQQAGYTSGPVWTGVKNLTPAVNNIWSN